MIMSKIDQARRFFLSSRSSCVIRDRSTDTWGRGPGSSCVIRGKSTDTWGLPVELPGLNEEGVEGIVSTSTGISTLDVSVADVEVEGVERILSSPTGFCRLAFARQVGHRGT